MSFNSIARLPCLLLALSTMPAAAQTGVPGPASAAAPVPAVERLTPETLNLGEMAAGQPKSGILTITNRGQSPVAVESIKSGCGCTKVSAAPSAPILPGRSITVEVTVDPGTKSAMDLSKPVYVKFDDGRTEVVQVKGRVRVVLSVTPATIDATDPPASAPSASAVAVVLESVDARPFNVTGVAPAGVVRRPTAAAPASRAELVVDLEGWVQAGRPASIVVSTDLPGAKDVVIPVRAAEEVAMFRLPAAGGGQADRAAAEARQAELLALVDAAIAAPERSPQFRMKLHRESGMLFVHGTHADLAVVRGAVAALPAAAGVREATPVRER